MSSPFNVFRKHQKALFAVLGIAVMFAFIFGDSILGRGRNSGQVQDPVVVDWKFDNHGPLHQSELKNTQQLLTRFNEFLRSLLTKMGGVPPRAPAVTERDAVSALLLSRLAEQKGMVISDKAIQTSLHQSFMHQQDGTPVKNSEIKEALAESGMSEYQLFAALRLRIMSGNMMSLFRQGFGVDTPIQRFGYYNRLERKVKA